MGNRQKETHLVVNIRGAWHGPSYFVSGSKYFPSRIVLDVTGDVTD